MSLAILCSFSKCAVAKDMSIMWDEHESPTSDYEEELQKYPKHGMNQTSSNFHSFMSTCDKFCETIWVQNSKARSRLAGTFSPRGRDSTRVRGVPWTCNAKSSNVAIHKKGTHASVLTCGLPPFKHFQTIKYLNGYFRYPKMNGYWGAWQNKLGCR